MGDEEVERYRPVGTPEQRAEWAEKRRVEQEEATYLSGLGAFIEAYALFEASLFSYLQKLADVYGAMAIIAFGALNVQQKQSAIYRIWRVNQPDPEIEKEVREVFKRSLDITEVRNSMLHYGSTVTTHKGRITTDMPRALKASEATEHRVTGETLMAMRMDILKCSTHLISLAIRPTYSLEQRQAASPGSALEHAWRYTHRPNDRPIARKSAPKRRKP